MTAATLKATAQWRKVTTNVNNIIYIISMFPENIKSNIWGIPSLEIPQRIPGHIFLESPTIIVGRNFFWAGCLKKRL